MRTIVSWHLNVTEEANREDFLKTFYTWFTENHRFNLPANFHKIEKEQERSFKVDDDTASVVCTSTNDDIYTSVYYSRHNATTNCSWLIEFIFVESKSGCPKYIVAHLRKKELSEKAEFKYQEHFEIKTPSVVKTLIDNGIATMEAKDATLQKYPTLYINSRKATSKELDILEKYSTICHLTPLDTDEGWTFKISFPRLSYEVEYYKEDCELEKLPEGSILRRRYLPKALDTEHLSPVVDNLFSMVNEGMGNYSDIDRGSVLKIYETNKNKKKVHLSQALAKAIKDKRQLNGFSQSELAMYASSEEYPLTGLMISRIEQYDKEKKLISRIEINKLHAIELALGLEEDYLVNIAKNAPSEEAIDFEKPLVESKPSKFPKFCSYCASPIIFNTEESDLAKFPKFCSYCGSPINLPTDKNK